MANKNDERPIRLRPRRSKANPNDDPRRYAGVVGSVLRFAQMAKRPRLRRGSRSRSQVHSEWQSRPQRLYSQRVSVRVTYAKNKTAGQWKSHGHYIARDGATKGSDPAAAGFDATRANVNIPATLDTWQRAGDERIFKIIVSPEFGERLNLQDQTRQLLARMEKNLATPLEWVAAAHFNTEHPHVHIGLRGRDQTGSPLRLSRDYIRSGIRFHAENIATEALGFRTERDAREAQRREITQTRFTGLDRIIQQSNHAQSSSFAVATDVTRPQLSERQRVLQQNLSARLAHLENLGLATSVGPQKWTVRSDFETILRAVQRSSDRQKMLAAHGALLSDPRLPFEITDIRKLKTVEGRVLLHAEDERSGRRYLLLEGTDAKVHLIYYTDSIEEARHAGKIAINNFVRLEKHFAGGLPQIKISDCGDADKLLENRVFLKKRIEASLTGAIAHDSHTWGGWLGRYYARLHSSIAMRKTPTRSSNAGQQR